jgi:flagellar FliJ protein
MTKRVKRLEPVKDLAAKTELAQAGKLAAAQRRAADARTKLQELQIYLDDYRSNFEQRARGGIGMSGLRDYQIFIARLQDAVQQQLALSERLSEECERERSQWLEYVARTAALTKVIASARAEDNRHADRRLQTEIDERAQRGKGAR